jgi:UPF0755 protein
LDDTVANGPDRQARRKERSARRRRRRLVVVGLVLVVLIVIIAVPVIWYKGQVAGSNPPGAPVQITVTSGQSTSSLNNALAAKGVIGSALALRIYDEFHGTPSVVPGRYLLHQNLSFAALRAALAPGPNIFPLIVVPGFTLNEVANSVEDLPGHKAVHFLATAKSGAVHSPYQPAGSNNLEGLLGSGTYQVLPKEKDKELLAQMVDRFTEQATAAGLSKTTAAALGLSEYEVITAASVVQKEGYIHANMPKVARVIYNRLANNMPLQMDSTVLYSLGQDGGTVTPADERIDTPYNSYLHTGLPPTPICIPSPTALAAAVHPPAGDWLYFVVIDKAGTEAFSATYAEQQANESLAQSRGVG